MASEASLSCSRRDVRSALLKVSLVSALVAVVGCEKQPHGVIPISIAFQPTASADSAPAADEMAALASPAFNRPLNLTLGVDGFGADQRLAAMHGLAAVSPEPNVVGINVEPCQDTQYNDSRDVFTASVEGYRFDNEPLVQWLIREGVVTRRTYAIQHQQPGDTFYGTTHTYVCTVVLDTIRRYLTSGASDADIHRGVTLPLLGRRFVAWTYRNRYQTDLLGMGKVQVFAGTYTYAMTTSIPGLGSTRLGTGSVKVFLNPDTGHWEVDSNQLSDPPMGFARDQR